MTPCRFVHLLPTLLRNFVPPNRTYAWRSRTYVGTYVDTFKLTSPGSNRCSNLFTDLKSFLICGNSVSHIRDWSWMKLSPSDITIILTTSRTFHAVLSRYPILHNTNPNIFAALLFGYCTQAKNKYIRQGKRRSKYFHRKIRFCKLSDGINRTIKFTLPKRSNGGPSGSILLFQGLRPEISKVFVERTLKLPPSKRTT
jgi:hypothetical protein